MKMLNSNVCCINLDEVVETVGKVIIPTNKKAYKTLKVIASGDEKVLVDSIIYVPINSGTEVKIEDKDYTVVNAREIILIVD